MIRRALLFIAASAISWVFLIQVCDVIYRCGCEPLWAGAADHCNMNRPGARHCPWCTVPYAYDATLALIFAAQAILALGPWNWGMLRRSILTLAAFPLVSALSGTALGLWSGYWR